MQQQHQQHDSAYHLSIEEDFIKEPETSASRCHTFCGQVINSATFQNGVIVLIVLNSLTMAIATFDFVKENESLENIFEKVDELFLVLFSVELFINFLYFGIRQFFSDSWLVFDFVVVSLSWGFRSLSVLRAFRVIRVLRLVTKMKAMQNIVSALSGVLPRMGAIFLLLGLIYFVFDVMFTEMFGSLYEEGYTSEDYFSRLDITCFTLLRLMFLDNWAEVIQETSQKYSWAWLPILTFIIVSTFIVVNLIIAVICDAVATIQTEEMTKQVVEIQRQTSNVLHQNEIAHHQEAQSLDAKMEELKRLIADLSRSKEEDKPESKLL